MEEVVCEICGTEQELSILDDPSPRCEDCGNRTLTQVKAGH